MKKLNLACGAIILNGWDNLDYESRVDGVISCNLLSGLPYEDNSVDEILTSHFLEHLKLRSEAIPFLQECERVLKPGGVLTIIVPDFEELFKVRHIDYHFKGLRNRKQGLRWLVGAVYGDGRTAWDYHSSGWFEERFREMGSGVICVDPAAGEPLKVWNEICLTKIIKKWRRHSAFEITAVFNKKANHGEKCTPPSWLNEKAVVGTGMISKTRLNIETIIIMLKITPLGKVLEKARSCFIKKP
jgi:SAM-dependent methyltransferase